MQASTIEIPFELIWLLRGTLRRGSASLVALTGAGVSQESGLRTFRDAQTGLWSQYKPEELASPQAFARDPKLIWDWYAWRREAVKGVRPNPGHYALVEMEKRALGFTLIPKTWTVCIAWQGVKICWNCTAIFNACAAPIVIGLQKHGRRIPIPCRAARNVAGCSDRMSSGLGRRCGAINWRQRSKPRVPVTSSFRLARQALSNRLRPWRLR